MEEVTCNSRTVIHLRLFLSQHLELVLRDSHSERLSLQLNLHDILLVINRLSRERDLT